MPDTYLAVLVAAGKNEQVIKLLSKSRRAAAGKGHHTSVSIELDVTRWPAKLNSI